MKRTQPVITGHLDRALRDAETNGQTETGLLAAADRRMYEAKRSRVADRIDDEAAA